MLLLFPSFSSLFHSGRITVSHASLVARSLQIRILRADYILIYVSCHHLLILFIQVLCSLSIVLHSPRLLRAHTSERLAVSQALTRCPLPYLLCIALTFPQSAFLHNDGPWTMHTLIIIIIIYIRNLWNSRQMKASHVLFQIFSRMFFALPNFIHFRF